MSIATAIENAQTKVENAYTAVSTKGGTLPATQDLSNLPTAITSIPSASSPVINELNVTPSTSAQTITASGGVDGFSPVNVSAVTSSIDANIVAGNIKNGVTILGVTGDYTGTTPSGTLPISANGIYDVTNYANADVQVSGSSALFNQDVTKWAGLEVDSNGVLQSNTGVSGSLIFNGVQYLSSSILSQKYQYDTQITSVSFPDLTSITDTANAALKQSFAYSAVTTASFPSLTSIVGYEACYATFINNTSLTSISLPELIAIGDPSSQPTQLLCCGMMFFGCSNLTSVSLPKLTTIYGILPAWAYEDKGNCYQTFAESGVVTADLSALETIGYMAANYMFSACASLTALIMKNLKVIGSYGCYRLCISCSSLTRMNFESLESLYNDSLVGAFTNCTSLQSLWFYALDTNSFNSYTTMFGGMLNSCSDVTVHFPIRIQGTIGSWTDVTNGFGGTNTTVLFDIVTELTGADSTTYSRNQKDSGSTYTCWKHGSTLYYTSGTSEPSVSDTIYSDSACTTPVTTVSAIA